MIWFINGAPIPRNTLPPTVQNEKIIVTVPLSAESLLVVGQIELLAYHEVPCSFFQEPATCTEVSHLELFYLCLALQVILIDRILSGVSNQYRLSLFSAYCQIFTFLRFLISSFLCPVYLFELTYKITHGKLHCRSSYSQAYNHSHCHNNTVLFA